MRLYIVEIDSMLFLLVENAHGSIENRSIVECHHTSVGALLYVDACSRLGVEMLASEVVTDGLYIDTQLVCYALRAAAGQLVLDAAQFVK